MYALEFLNPSTYRGARASLRGVERFILLPSPRGVERYIGFLGRAARFFEKSTVVVV